jgi:hypothetical protein
MPFPAWDSANDAVLSRFTGREFVLHNQSLASLGASRIGLGTRR